MSPVRLGWDSSTSTIRILWKPLVVCLKSFISPLAERLDALMTVVIDARERVCTAPRNQKRDTLLPPLYVTFTVHQTPVKQSGKRKQIWCFVCLKKHHQSRDCRSVMKCNGWHITRGPPISSLTSTNNLTSLPRTQSSPPTLSSHMSMPDPC